MPHSIRIGRVAGVPLSLHWSVVLVAGLVTWGLASGRFPEQYAGHSAGAYWVAGAAATVLSLGSLVAHELAHAVVARRHGIEVDGMTLWALGGLTRMEAEADDARTELRVAGAGPLASAVLGAVGLAFALLL